jgi:hypothetical protein
MMRVAKLFIVVAMGATTQENKKQRWLIVELFIIVAMGTTTLEKKQQWQGAELLIIATMEATTMENQKMIMTTSWAPRHHGHGSNNIRQQKTMTSRSRTPCCCNHGICNVGKKIFMTRS